MGNSPTKENSETAPGVEQLDACPLCQSPVRELIGDGLADIIFNAAPGSWQLWRCGQCGVAYLDPRLDPANIHVAYDNYYTHGSAAAPARIAYNRLTWLQKVRRRLANGYMNSRYGESESPSSGLGTIAVHLMRARKHLIDRTYRHMPRVAGGHLLDIGCGDGTYLQLAQSLGWTVCGIDPDPSVAAATRTLDVRQGGIEVFDGEYEAFDYITLNHVLEHVHDPHYLLRRCHELLRPGGRLWLETPNINGPCFRQFGEYWRGLEVPRHLTMFNATALKQITSGAGFTRLRWHFNPSATLNMFEKSYALQCGHSPYDPVDLPVTLSLRARFADLIGRLSVSHREFLTMSAQK